MKQCSSCWRFLPDCVEECTHCSDLDLIEIEMPKGRYDNFKINIAELDLGGIVYKIEDVICKKGSTTVLQVGSNGKSYALKVSQRFNEFYTNSSGNDKSDLQESELKLNKEIEVLKDLPNISKLKIPFFGKIEKEYDGKIHKFNGILSELAETNYKMIMNYVAVGGYIPESEKKNIIYEVLTSLDYIHQHGIHRDLSLDNIFLVNRNEKIEFMVADFGSAKSKGRVESSVAKNSERESLLYTHDEYADPRLEKDLTAKNDFRCDVYSEGLILAEIMTGVLWPNFGGYNENEIPVVKENMEELLFEKCYKDVLSTQAYNFLVKTIFKDITKRYKDGRDLFKAFINEIYRNESVHLLKHKGKFVIKIEIDTKLPDQLNGLYEYEYFGRNHIDLHSLKNIKISFNDKNIEMIDKAKLRGTMLYEIESCDPHEIVLKLNRKKVLKMLGGTQLFLTSKGNLSFYFELEVEFFQRL